MDINTPAQEDEADILQEMGAERDENGKLVVSEEDIREAGAVDPESVRENRRLRAIVSRKRKGEKNVAINTGDVLDTYDTVLGSWPANTLDVHMRRLTGAPVQRVIISRPRSGKDLYEAFRQVHGEYDEADYEIKIKDSTTQQFRGHGRITMPNTRQQPANPWQQQQSVYAGQVVTQPPTPPAPAPVVVQTPVGTDLNSMLQMFEMFRKMTQPQQAPQPPQPPAMPPMPPSGSSPAEQMAWVQQMFEMFQKMQGGVTPSAPVQPAPLPAPAPVPAPRSPVSEMMEMIKLFQQMQAVMQPPAPPAAPVYRGPRPPYGTGYPQGNGQGGPATYVPPPPPRQQTVAEQFREATTVIRTAVDAVREIDMLGLSGREPEAPSVEENDNSPIVVTETVGKIKLAHDKNTGAMRWAETGMMALPDMLRWLGEQREAIQKVSNERQVQQQQPRQQLAPGYVEVGPGYQPPPGYVAVPVDETGAPLPPEPADIPPPIQDEPAPARRTWGAPTIPGSDPNDPNDPNVQ